MKGVVEEFFEKVGMPKKVNYDPKRRQAVPASGHVRQTSYMTELSLATWERYILLVLDNYNIGTRAYVAVLDMPAIVPFTTFDRKYEGIAKFPAVSRDLSHGSTA